MLDPGTDSLSLAGEVGCVRTGPSLYGAAGLSRRIFPKRKRPLGALWGTLLQQARQVRAWGCSCPGPRAGPRDLFVLTQKKPSVFSVSCILFGLLSSYMLGYCWLLALFLSRSARCFTRVQGEVDSAPTYLTTFFLLSTILFLLNSYFFV